MTGDRCTGDRCPLWHRRSLPGPLFLASASSAGPCLLSIIHAASKAALCSRTEGASGLHVLCDIRPSPSLPKVSYSVFGTFRTGMIDSS
jgi:hypothetical protein